MTVEFYPCEIKYWPGRYGRIAGNESTFHIRYNNGEWWLVIDWYNDGHIATCSAVDCPGVRDLAREVNAGKERLGGAEGGAFLINEFSQVIVPSSAEDDVGMGMRVIVGEINGSILFDNPFDDEDNIDISDSGGLNCGDPWKLPYVGIPHNLNRDNEIYFRQSHQRGIDFKLPPEQDRELVNKLRNVRPTGPVRFIVNPYGIVLTKRPPEWEPVYVGHINYNCWFGKEEV